MSDLQQSEDALMTTSNNITDALQRTIALMRGELETSVLTTQLFGKTLPCLVRWNEAQRSPSYKMRRPRP